MGVLSDDYVVFTSVMRDARGCLLKKIVFFVFGFGFFMGKVIELISHTQSSVKEMYWILGRFGADRC